LIDRAVEDGFAHRAACAILQLSESRAWRWRARRELGELEDRRSGGHAVHGLLDWEVTEILQLFEQYGEIDRSHRKLAHRGSYTRRVWVSPATVFRVLAANGLVLEAPPRPGPAERAPFPEWATYTKNSIWIYDAERHEALWNRAVMKGHRPRLVAASRAKLGAAYPVEADGHGRQAALTAATGNSPLVAM
jgi:putative transposase